MERSTPCANWQQDLVLYYYGECGEEHRKKIAEHLNGCPSCTALLADLSKILPATVKKDDPHESFWQDYTRELRGKIAAVEKTLPWWRSFLPTVSWPGPAIATAAALILAVALTFTVVKQRPEQLPTEETELLEITAMGQSLEFFKAMDLLDSMDLLEVMGGPGDGAA